MHGWMSAPHSKLARPSRTIYVLCPEGTAGCAGGSMP